MIYDVNKLVILMISLNAVLCLFDSYGTTKFCPSIRASAQLCVTISLHRIFYQLGKHFELGVLRKRSLQSHTTTKLSQMSNHIFSLLMMFPSSSSSGLRGVTGALYTVL